MKKVMKVFLTLFLVVVFACVLNLWMQTSPWIQDYKVIHRRDTVNHLVMAFATALRVFLSYSQNDEKFIQKLAGDLRRSLAAGIVA